MSWLPRLEWTFRLNLIASTAEIEARLPGATTRRGLTSSSQILTEDDNSSLDMAMI